MTRILIVEDDALCRIPLQRVLQTRLPGDEIAAAEHGRDALDWIAEHGDVDIILLDLRMPVMDGHEFLKVYDGEAAIIVVSAWADEEGIRPKADAYVRKPISTIDLLEAIIEYDPEIKIWALDEQGALDFFGFQRDRFEIRVVKSAPETEHEKQKYSPNAKLFALKVKE